MASTKISQLTEKTTPAGTEELVVNDSGVSKKIKISNLPDNDTTYSVGDGGLTEINFTSAKDTKLTGIETGATADQTGAEIKTAYEAEADTNAFTDAEKTKLSGIATGAEVNVQSDWNAASGDAQILNKPNVQYTSAIPDATASQTGLATSTQITKLDGIEASADVTDTANVVASLTAGTNITIAGDGTISATDTDTGILNVVEDTTPQLGGNLDTNGNNINFGDSAAASDDRLTFGADNDLQIYHDGTNSKIVDTGTGGLLLRGSTFVALQSTDGENAVVANQDSAVDLYYDNSKKLATTSTGIDVTGTVTADGLTVQGGITESQVTNSGTSYTIDLTAGTIFNLTSASTCTVTMPSLASGKSFTIIAAVPAAWSGTILWSGGAAPTGTGKCIYTFVSNGTNWYGMEAGSDFA